MEPTTIALLIIGLCVLLILAEMPVALAIGLSGVVGIIAIGDLTMAARTLGSVPYTATAKYALFAIPTYVLLGCVIANAGIGTQIYRIVNKLVYRLPGGLPASSVIATSIFSGISGSSAADVATFGRISVSEMARNGVDRAYAAAVVAAAGTFAVLIPPSITIVLYAIIAQESIGAMILAGVIPGIISCAILTLVVIGRGYLDRRRGQVVAAGAISDEALSSVGPVSEADGVGGAVAPPVAVPRSRAASIRDDLLVLGYAVVLFLVVVGGLYAGVFTATEAGAVGALVAMVIAIIETVRNRGSLSRLIWNSLSETAEITSMIFLLLVGGSIFTFALALSGLPAEIAAWTGGLDVPPWAVIMLILLLLIPLGAILDGLSVMLLTIPILAPIALELGYDGVWFGILVLKVIEVGLITPPVGINAFIITGITNTPLEKVFRALVPFVILDLAVTGLFFAFPDLVLWLPRLAGLVS